MYCRASATLAMTSSSRITVMVNLSVKEELDRKSIKSRACLGSESLHYRQRIGESHAAGRDGYNVRRLELERPPGRRDAKRCSAVARMPSRASAALEFGCRALRCTQGSGKPS